MATKLFVGRLAYSTTNDGLQAHFTAAGKVVSAQVIVDKFTGQGKGFGFVEMATQEEADKAISTLNNSTLDGRAIVVNEARPQEDRRNQQRSGGFNRQNRW